MDSDDDQWIKINKGKCTNPLAIFKPTYYHQLSHDYATKPEFAADPEPKALPNAYYQPPASIPSTFKHKAQLRAEARQFSCQLKLDEDNFLEEQITWAEDLCTTDAKCNKSKQHLAIDKSH